MIKITNTIWIGDSDDEKKAEENFPLVDSVLIVAHDMNPTHEWDDGFEYMQVGLIDGPGNPLAAYHAAVLALVTLAKRGKVLVCDHDGGRALAVVIMYLYMRGDGPSWDEAIERLKARRGILPFIDPMHRKAFFLMDWGMLQCVIAGEVSDQ